MERLENVQKGTDRAHVERLVRSSKVTEDLRSEVGQGPAWLTESRRVYVREDLVRLLEGYRVESPARIRARLCGEARVGPVWLLESERI